MIWGRGVHFSHRSTVAASFMHDTLFLKKQEELLKTHGIYCHSTNYAKISVT